MIVMDYAKVLLEAIDFKINCMTDCNFIEIEELIMQAADN